jgi:DNA-binding transcriptional ArsR family regulator
VLQLRPRVGAIAEQLEAGQQNVSKHLNVLTDAGILHRRKDGTRVFYGIADDGVFDSASRSAARSTRNSRRSPL